MEFLHHLLENSSAPIWSALILGLMTALSPCPLATNITAIGFISKDIEHKNLIFLNGIMYTLGRAFSYTSLGLIIYFGASRFHVAQVFQGWGERFMGYILIVIGAFMLDLIKIKFPVFSRLKDKIGNNKGKGFGKAFLLGVAFALAFCPYSGALYFGLLIPLTITSTSGLYLPVLFALATGLPVIFTAWLLAYSIASIGNFYNKLKSFEKWFRRIVAILFIFAGVYYLTVYFIK